MENKEHPSLNIPDTGKPRVAIVGGGFGGINAAKKLKDKGFQVVLFDKHNYHTFQPLLYQVATAGLQPDSIAGPLRNIFKGQPDFHFRLFRITAINAEKNMISTPVGDLRYDYLVIAAGSKPNFFGNKKIEQFSLPLKSIPDALNLRSQFMQILEQAEMTQDMAERKALLSFVMVGGGPTGVETAGALAELKKAVLPKDYPALDFSEMKIYLIEGLGRLLAQMSEQAGARAQRDLEKMGVIPGVAQAAIQMGSYVGKNIPKLHKGEPVHAFKYFDKGTLATIGRGKAVADLPGNIHFGGRLAWWIWLFIHINYLVSFRNKLLVFASWIWNYFTYDKGNRLIIRPYIRKKGAAGTEIASTNVKTPAGILH